MSYVDFGNIVQ